MLFSSLLQDVPADTTSYMIMGFVVIFGMMALYVISLIMRRRNLEQDLEVLQEMEQDE
jgi:hypothetical protein